MATEVRSYDITIPAGTPANAPVTVDASFAPLITEAIEWEVPAGSMGLMGWRLTSGGAQVIPKNPGAWVIAHRQAGRWELAELHDSGAWQVTGYNTGTFPHVIRLRFHTSPITKAPPLVGSLAWLEASPPGLALAQVGTLAAAPEAVRVPRAALWPPADR